ncbi:MAG: redoxin domain-containing protein [Bacteroidales bacterium]|nr:redoxin domain-containing protein [Bacteroidales bacterium]
MSKQLQLIIIQSIIFCVNSYPQNSKYELWVKADQLQGEEIELVYYYDNAFLHLDDVHLDITGNGLYEDIDHQGIYRFIFPDSSIFDFLVTAPGTYRIHKSKNGFRLEANSAGETYEKFNSFMAVISMKIDSLAHLPGDKQIIREEKDRLKLAADSLINHYSLKEQGNLAGYYFRALMPVTTPDFRLTEPGLSDSARLYKSLTYYRDHYLDNIDLNIPELIYTPVLSGRISNYIKLISEQSPEGQVAAIHFIMEKCKDPRANQSILSLLLRQYESMVHKPPQEYAYLYLAENYFLRDTPDWSPPPIIEELRKNINTLKPLAIKSIAPDIALPDAERNTCQLSMLEADAIIVLFWDFTCPVCRKVLDEFRKVTEKYTYKDILVYTVYIGEDKEIWDAWLAKKLKSGWTNTYLNGNTDVLKTWRLEKAPVLYLLNRDHVIVDKYFTVSELDEFLSELPY